MPGMRSTPVVLSIRCRIAGMSSRRNFPPSILESTNGTRSLPTSSAMGTTTGSVLVASVISPIWQTASR